MITKEDIQNLAKLARVTVDESELDAFAKDLENIVAYVGQLEKLELAKSGFVKPVLRNVMRVDGEACVPGTHTKEIVEQFPTRSGDALLVKQIISHE